MTHFDDASETKFNGEGAHHHLVYSSTMIFERQYSFHWQTAAGTHNVMSATLVSSEARVGMIALEK
jgi:hypothetical protein